MTNRPLEQANFCFDSSTVPLFADDEKGGEGEENDAGDADANNSEEDEKDDEEVKDAGGIRVGELAAIMLFVLELLNPPLAPSVEFAAISFSMLISTI